MELIHVSAPSPSPAALRNLITHPLTTLDAVECLRLIIPSPAPGAITSLLTPREFKHVFSEPPQLLTGFQF